MGHGERKQDLQGRSDADGIVVHDFRLQRNKRPRKRSLDKSGGAPSTSVV